MRRGKSDALGPLGRNGEFSKSMVLNRPNGVPFQIVGTSVAESKLAPFRVTTVPPSATPAAGLMLLRAAGDVIATAPPEEELPPEQPGGIAARIVDTAIARVRARMEPPRRLGESSADASQGSRW